jgi:hypothetical protein
MVSYVHYVGKYFEVYKILITMGLEKFKEIPITKSPRNKYPWIEL